MVFEQIRTYGSSWRLLFQALYLGRFVPMVAHGGCYFSQGIRADSYLYGSRWRLLFQSWYPNRFVPMVADGGCFFSHGIQTDSYLWQQMEAVFLVMVSEQIHTYGSRRRLLFQSGYPSIFFFFFVAVRPFAPSGHIDTLFPVRPLYPEPRTRPYEIRIRVD